MGFRDEARGYVYFFIRQNLIKVGFTIDLRRRLYGLDGSFADFLAVVDDCTMADEKAAHVHLKAWRSHREWFHATDQCLAAIQWLVDGGIRARKAPITRPFVPKRFADAPEERRLRVCTAPDLDARSLLQAHIRATAQAGALTVTCPQIRRMTPLIPRTRTWVREELIRLCEAPSEGEVQLARAPGQPGVYLIVDGSRRGQEQPRLSVPATARPRSYANAGHRLYIIHGGTR